MANNSFTLSGQVPASKDFYLQIRGKIRINPRNLTLSSRYRNNDSFEEDYDTALLRVLENSYRKFKKPRYLAHIIEEEKSSLKLDSGSSFILFILRKKHYRDVVPDIELTKYKEVCCDMISKLSNCHEAHFGLAKLLTHEGYYDQSEQHLNIALSEEKYSQMYNMWLGVIKSLSSETKQQALTTKKFCETLIKNLMKSIELYWALMNLALSDLLSISEEIESPHHYAAKIKNIDRYYGYLAWAEVLMRSGNSLSKEKAEDVLKELTIGFQSRPEAYIKLWYFYYSAKDYVSALSVAETAFLKLAESSAEYSVIINLNYARSLYKLEKYRSCFELLQMMYTQNSQYSVYLYHYGRMCLKSKDSVFLGSAIGALEECLKICNIYRHGSIYYWLMIGYMTGGDKIQAYKYAKSGIGLLTSTVEKHGVSFGDKNYEQKVVHKINEMKNVAKDLHMDILNMEILDKIIENKEQGKYEEAKLHCKNISKFDKVEGAIFNSKLLLAMGDHDGAMGVLYKSLSLSSLQMKGFFMLADILLKTQKHGELEKICKDMMKKCKSPMIPVQVWIKTHMVYIKCLLNRNAYEKAILVLKSLAQVQPSPFIPDLEYTRNLQFATSKDHLVNLFENYKRDSLLGDGDIQNTILCRAKLLCSRRNLSSMVIESDSDGEIVLALEEINGNYLNIGSRAPEPLPKARLSRTPCGDAVNTGFSVSVSYKFLYKIGKIAAKHKVCVEDGYCAMHDFLNIHHYWMREGIESDEIMQVKGSYWLAVLLFLKGDMEEAVHIFKEIMSMLFQLNMQKMSQQILVYMKEYQSSVNGGV